MTTRILLIALLVIAANPACSPSPPATSAPGDGYGLLRVQLHDAPVDEVDEVRVTVDEVWAVHETDGRLLVSSTPRALDLLELQGGITALLGVAALPVGAYTQIRLHVTDASVVAEGQEHPLEIPSGGTSGLKLEASFELPDCGEVVIDLDWDVGAQLNRTPRGWKLRPVLHVDIETDTAGCDDCEPTVLPDPALDAAVRALGFIPDVGPISADDAAAVTSINAPNRGIVSLEGLQCMVNLQSLELAGNEITDLAPIRGATSLTRLSVGNNPALSDLSPIAGLTRMDALAFGNDSVVDLSPLAGMTILTRIDAFNNGFADIGALASMPLLGFAALEGNAIADLTPLAGLTALTRLQLDSNDIADVSALSELRDLQHLSLTANRIAAVDGLSSLTRLDLLALHDNAIGDVAPLASLINLRFLSLSRNQLSELGAVTDMTGLIHLDIDGNSIDDLGPVAGKPNLTRLLADGNRIDDISATAGLTSLEWLRLTTNRIAELSPVSGLSTLATLQVGNNLIRNTGPLAGMYQLGFLEINNNDYACPDAVLADLEANGVIVQDDCP